MKCNLCPLACGADRPNAAGACGVKGITVAKYALHPYEEPPISFRNGAGAVFFGGCSLRCVFCQNFELSRAERGKEVSPKELAAIFREVEEMGADTLDLVTCDHIAPLVAEALSLYKPKIPAVFNSGGYVTERALEILDPYIDVWMPDLKFRSPELAARYTRRADYFEYASRALRYMTKKPVLRDGNRLLSGLMVRHLVMPACGYDSLAVLDFLKETVPADTPLSLMRQYTPIRVFDYPELNRTVTAREYRRVTDYALALGFTEIYTQDASSADPAFIPKWDF